MYMHMYTHIYVGMHIDIMYLYLYIYRLHIYVNLTTVVFLSEQYHTIRVYKSKQIQLKKIYTFEKKGKKMKHCHVC